MMVKTSERYDIKPYRIVYWNTELNRVQVMGRGEYRGLWFEYLTTNRTEGYFGDTFFKRGSVEDMLSG